MIADAATPYEQACAILRHLQRYYRYTLSPVTPPENQDFVTYFLYVGKEGYCTYFASAMTVLCRMAGLPARYVEGFLAQPDSSGFAYVTGQNAHAWTEAYFEGFGWVPFDPYPCPAERGSAAPAERPGAGTHADPQPGTAAGRAGSDRRPARKTRSRATNRTIPIPRTTSPTRKTRPLRGCGCCSCLLAAVAAVVRQRIFLRMPDRMAKKQQNVSDQNLPVWQRRLYPDEADGPHAQEGRNASALCPPHG